MGQPLSAKQKSGSGDDAALRERALARRANWQTDVAPYVERLRAERREAWLGRG